MLSPNENTVVSYDSFDTVSSDDGNPGGVGGGGGGFGGEIVVVGRATGYVTEPYNPPPGYDGNGYSGEGGFSGGGNPGAPMSPEEQANAFGNDHVRKVTEGNLSLEFAQRSHEILEGIFSKAASSPNDTIYAGNGRFITMGEVLSYLNYNLIKIGNSTTLSGPNGADTLADAPGLTSNWIDVSSNNMSAYSTNFLNSTGVDFVILHELGHAISYFSSDAQHTGNFSRYTDEREADTIGRSLQYELGLPATQLIDGSAYSAPDGYY